jgi:lysozyme
MTANMKAFLSMISHSEGTDRAPDPYRVCYAYKHVIADLTYHPAEIRPDGTCEWRGESLAHLGSYYENKISTAAGRYQIIKPTWLELKSALRLTDFTGPSQDDACVLDIKRAGALDLVNSGQIADAIGRCHEIWASLPGSTAIDQPKTPLALLMSSYVGAGGAFA